MALSFNRYRKLATGNKGALYAGTVAVYAYAQATIDCIKYVFGSNDPVYAYINAVYGSEETGYAYKHAMYGSKESVYGIKEAMDALTDAMYVIKECMYAVKAILTPATEKTPRLLCLYYLVCYLLRHLEFG